MHNIGYTVSFPLGIEYKLSTLMDFETLSCFRPKRWTVEQDSNPTDWHHRMDFGPVTSGSKEKVGYSQLTFT